MKLELVKKHFENINQLSVEEIKFNLIKSSIKKDLEVVSFHHRTTKVFGEFQIYSDYKSELNSFENIVSFLIGKSFDYVGESVEAKISCKCPEHFLNYLITKGYSFDEFELDKLAIKYTNYIIEASEIILAYQESEISNEISILDLKYFSGNDPTAMCKYLNPHYLNN